MSLCGVVVCRPCLCVEIGLRDRDLFQTNTVPVIEFKKLRRYVKMEKCMPFVWENK